MSGNRLHLGRPHELLPDNRPDSSQRHMRRPASGISLFGVVGFFAAVTGGFIIAATLFVMAAVSDGFAQVSAGHALRDLSIGPIAGLVAAGGTSWWVTRRIRYVALVCAALVAVYVAGYVVLRTIGSAN